MNEVQPLVLTATGATVRPIALDAPRAYHLPRWGQMSDPDRLKFLRSVAVQRGRDPRIRALAFRLVTGTRERDYPAQAARLLRAVQPGGPLMAYLNEPGEQLQDPLYTLRVRGGDCDDAALLLASLFEALRLPWRFVLSGRYRAITDAPGQATGPRARWVEGTPYPRGVKWGHIYTTVGWPIFAPPEQTTWAWADPTIRNAPLGWDVTSHLQRTGQSVLPELAGGLAGDLAGASGGMMPIFEPAHNLRELCKEAALLEDHLCHPEKRCGDCIRKHLLKMEALAEEALTLDRDGAWEGRLRGLPEHVRQIARAYVGGMPPARVMQEVRRLRKHLTPMCFTEGLGGELGDPGAPAGAGTSSVIAAGTGAVSGSSQRTIIETVLISVTTMVMATVVIEYLRAKKLIPSLGR